MAPKTLSSKSAALGLALMAMAASPTEAAQSPSFGITSKSYTVKNSAKLQTACQDEFGAGSRTADFDQDLVNHKWSTIEKHLPELQRFTHYWAQADSDYLDALSASRGVVLEYLWGHDVEPVLMGDGEMPSFMKVQVVCWIPAGRAVPRPRHAEAPTITASAYGHLHVSTWSGDTMDLKNMEGSCQFTLLENPHFLDRGIAIRVRTKTSPMWSYIESALLEIGGQDRLEVAGGQDGNHYWVNGEYQGNLNQLAFPVTYHQANARQRDFVVDFGEGTLLKFKTFQKYVRVDLETPGNNAELEGSFGLMGSFSGGEWIGKDKVTLLETPHDFAKEWAGETGKGLFATPSAVTDKCEFEVVSGSSHKSHHNHRAPEDKEGLRDAVQKLQEEEEALLGDIRSTRRRLEEQQEQGKTSPVHDSSLIDTQTA